MSSITGLSNYSQFNYSQNTTTQTYQFLPQRLYSGYIINYGDNQLTVTFITIDKNNKINQLDPITLDLWTQLKFKNLWLYQMIITVSGTPTTYTYNIIGIDYSNTNVIKSVDPEPIPEFELIVLLNRDISGHIVTNPGILKDSNAIVYVNMGFSPLIAGGPISADITVPTSISQLYSTVNKIVPMVILTADSTNTTTIFIGGSGQTPVYPLKAGQTITLFFINPAAIFGYTTTTGQILHMLIMN